MKIAYILGAFPDLTTTFVDREILEVQRRGVELVLISTRKLDSFEMGAEIRRLAETTQYILPVQWGKFVRAHIRFALI